MNSINIFMVLAYMLVCTHNFEKGINNKTEKLIVYILAFSIVFFPSKDLHFIVLNVVVAISGLALFRQKKKKQA